ncbi:hypothetical protein F66182_2829 [Fusarium sp. NRRL 66182]|nr:hypothetical protein F66182_2829 [Fusarium sp. NRRL 66182]
MAAVVNGVPVALPPLPGYEVDFENPQRNSVTEAYWLFGVGNFLSLLFVAQRIYSKCVIQKSLRIEDGDFIRGIMGTHAWEMPLTKFADFALTLYLLPILYNPVQGGAKMALLLVYRRLAPQKWFHATVWFTGFVVVGSSFALTFVTIFPCRPIRAGWDITVANATCVDRPAIYKATAALGAATDFMVLAIPIPVVIPLKISRRQKVGLICFFSVGGVTVFTSIMRLIALIKSMNTADQTWGGGPVLLWIFAEANLSIICATLTTVKPFFKHVYPRLLGTTNLKSGSGLAFSNPSAPPTIGGISTGGNARHGQYERFDDGPMYPLQTVTKAEASEPTQDFYHSRGDSGSEKAIIQTRTTTVAYSD